MGGSGLSPTTFIPTTPGWDRTFEINAGKSLTIELCAKVDSITEALSAGNLSVRIPWTAYHLIIIGDNTQNCDVTLNGGNTLEWTPGLSVTWDNRVIKDIKIESSNAGQNFKVSLW